MTDSSYFAHSRNDAGYEHPLRDHLQAVGELAGSYGDALGLASAARMAGRLHDLGKYGDLFQARLRNQESGIDHWSMGAWLVYQRCSAQAVAVAIQGHHIGLQRLVRDELQALDPETLAREHPLSLRLSEPSVDLLEERFRDDGLSVPVIEDVGASTRPRASPGGMLDVRMLFSCLVDADYLDTEAHFAGDEHGKRYRPDGPALRPIEAFDVLHRHVEDLARGSDGSREVLDLRSDLWRASVSAGDHAASLRTLTAPTGSGKTLAMVGYALRHAACFGRRRIIVVIPFLSIIEQTADILRRIFEPVFGSEYVLEHHSLAGTGQEKTATDEEDAHIRRARLLSENWDAPLVVTTSVQFFESLFSNRPGACRKLHRLAESVVLCDEVQTLPRQLALPTLATLSRLADRYRTTVVLATATQPAYEAAHEKIRSLETTGWAPVEIVPAELSLFERARRTTVSWPAAGQTLSWEALADALLAVPEALCIVNMKRHAVALAELLREAGAEGLFHLSTAMCPAHRRVVLDQVRARLAKRQACRLVSTQCVEAGVDVDFRNVWRAMGPLEAIAQAAGRCNRAGLKDDGAVAVFRPEPDDRRMYPTAFYGEAADVTERLVRRQGNLDLDDPGVFRSYYRRLFAQTPLDQGTGQELLARAREMDFPEVAKLYQIIDGAQINVLVPYDREVHRDLADQAASRGISRDWVRKARPHSISCYAPPDGDPFWQHAVAVDSRFRRGETDWWIYGDADHYDDLLGLQPRVDAAWIG